MSLEKIRKQVAVLKSYRAAADESGEKADDKDPNAPRLEGISFRYKTVQYHLIDDTFEELKKEPETFGDIKIYSERFSLPGFGERVEDLDGNEYQFEVIVFIESKVNSDAYFEKLSKAAEAIENKHGVQILITQYEKQGSEPSYNVHRIMYYTKEEGIFSKE